MRSSGEDYATGIKVESGERPRPRIIEDVFADALALQNANEGGRDQRRCSAAHQVHPPGAVARRATIAELPDAPFALAPPAESSRLRNEQAPQAIACRALEPRVAEAAFPLTESASFWRVIDGWQCHGPSSVGCGEALPFARRLTCEECARRSASQGLIIPAQGRPDILHASDVLPAPHHS